MRASMLALCAFSSVSLFSLAAPTLARAEEPASAAREYSASETRSGYGRLGLGAVSLAGGAYELTRGTAFDTGLGVPLLVGGALQAGLGVATVARDAGSDGTRIDRALARLHVAEAVEATTMIAGTLTAYFGSRNDSLRGAGWGIAIESGMMLVTDVFRERRADKYAEALKTVHVAAVPLPGGAAASISGSF